MFFNSLSKNTGICNKEDMSTLYSFSIFSSTTLTHIRIEAFIYILKILFRATTVKGTTYYLKVTTNLYFHSIPPFLPQHTSKIKKSNYEI